MDQAVPPSPPLAAPQPPPDSTLHFLDYWRIIRIRKTVILAVFLLVVITATLVTFVLPKKYESKVRLKIEGDIADIGVMGDGRYQGSRYDIYFLQTEFEIIQSQMILQPVIEDEILDLNHKWAVKLKAGASLKTEESLRRLKSMMSVRPARNTSLIEIQVRSEDPVEAKQLADRIATEYTNYRLRTKSQQSDRGIGSLEKELANHDQKVKAADEKVSQLREDLRITDAEIAQVGTGYLLEQQSLRQLETSRIELEPLYIQQVTLFTNLTELKESELQYAILTAVQPDPVLQQALSDLTYAEGKMISLTNDFGPGSSEIRNLTPQISFLKVRVHRGVQGILDGLRIKILSYSNQLATITTNKAIKELESVRRARDASDYFRLKRDLESLQRFRDALSIKLAQERVDAAIPKFIMVTITDSAVVATEPVQPNKPLAIGLGVVIGLVVGVGLAFFIEYLDTSVKTIDEVERSLQAPVLGVIPQNVGYLIKEGSESPHAEAYRVLRTNLLFSRKDEKLTSIVVVSAGAGEGKSTTVFNLATIFAMHGNRVIIVDSDLRRPTIHKILGVSNSLGLTNYLLKQNTLEQVIQTSTLPTLDVMPSGKLPSSSMGILNSKAMRDLINELKRRYDYVFFDSPPMVGLSDASILCSEMDLSIQVIQYRRYPQPMTIRAKQMIEKVGGKVAGIVLNNINMSQDEYYYYYSGYYGGYYGDYYSKQDDKDAEGGETGKKGKVEIKQKY